MADEERDPAPFISAEPEPPRAPQPRYWNLGDVVLIAVMYFVSLIVGGIVIAFVGKRFGLDPRTLLTDPLVLIPLQAAGYLFTYLCARIVVTLKTRRPFIESIEWNYPGAERLPQLLLLGLVVALGATVIAAFLPHPENPPVKKYFETPTSTTVSMIFAVLIAPLAEELYFRGLFYPALRRSLDDDNSRRILGAILVLLAFFFGLAAYQGMGTSYALFAPILLAFGLLLVPLRPETAALLDEDRQTMIAVVLTSVLFAYIHQAQLGNSWGAVVPILLVGLIITTIRVRLNSVAAGWILHCGYNGAVSLMIWAGSTAVRKVS